MLGLVYKAKPDSRILQNSALLLTGDGTFEQVLLLSAMTFFSPKKMECVGRGGE